MSRIKRYKLANVAYLVSQRGHNRLPCFYDGEDYVTFLDALRRLSDSHGCKLHDWSLVPDGYWVLLTPSSGAALAALMQTLGRLYVRYANRKYGRTGTLWASRYRACIVEPESLCFEIARRYVITIAEQNLVVSSEDAWPWQSSPQSSALTEDESQKFKTLESTLIKGLVFGSPAFLSMVESATSVRTNSLTRGRPRKNPAKQTSLSSSNP